MKDIQSSVCNTFLSLLGSDLLSRYSSPAECYMASSPTPILFGWSVGLSGYCLPGNNGYRIGASSYTHIMLEVSDNTIN